MRAKQTKHNLKNIYSSSQVLLGQNNWRRLLTHSSVRLRPESLPAKLGACVKKLKLPGFLAELAALEWALHKVSKSDIKTGYAPRNFRLNPTLELLHLSWKLSPFFIPKKRIPSKPKKKEEWVLAWKDARSKKINFKSASSSELLAIKIVAGKIPLSRAAKAGNAKIWHIETALSEAAKAGLLIAPRPRIRRDTAIFNKRAAITNKHIFSDIFTLQWHITHACDLHCKHCYDRSRRSPLTFNRGVRLLDDLKDFCRHYRVEGHVCFTGGNPFLYPHFKKLYAAAAERGFSISILGNPTPKAQLKEIIDIAAPEYFQISLEGLKTHNDAIRGAGHFQKAMKFLKTLRRLKVSSAVMLTLTNENIDQIIPLAEKLSNLSDYFTFNRLSQVGKGASLKLASPEKYASFLRQYITKSRNNPIMGFKDNLINIVLRKKNMPVFSGCTGYGCGAAFNFLAVLADGEVHACRKFPSLIGNILKQNISQIYESRLARRYRKGSRGCNRCIIRHICGGCLAISYSHGKNIFKDTDPYCAGVQEGSPIIRP